MATSSFPAEYILSAGKGSEKQSRSSEESSERYKARSNHVHKREGLIR